MIRRYTLATAPSVVIRHRRHVGMSRREKKRTFIPPYPGLTRLLIPFVTSRNNEADTLKSSRSRPGPNRVDRIRYNE